MGDTAPESQAALNQGEPNFAGSAKEKDKAKRRRKIGSEEWPYAITVNIKNSPKPKIAFLSGEERGYYPENPGHSKLAQVFTAQRNKGDSPPCMYLMPPIGVNKPISTLGYGMGGLLAKRFPKPNKREKRPEPGTYQELHTYPTRPNIFDFQNPLITMQCRIGFSTSLTVPRFGPQKLSEPPGPGFYNFGLCTGCPSLNVKELFGTKRCLVPTVITICAVKEGELCHECRKEQRFDYYRSRARVLHPNTKKPEVVVLCRKCYCRAWNGHHPFWTKKSLSFVFQKARHCSYMHDHGGGLENYITKATLHDVGRLSKKEAVMAKYFGDCCPPETVKDKYM